MRGGGGVVRGEEEEEGAGERSRRACEMRPSEDKAGRWNPNWREKAREGRGRKGTDTCLMGAAKG